MGIKSHASGEHSEAYVFMVKSRIQRDIPFEKLQQHFDKTLRKASEELGVSVTALKRVCKDYGIKRWPYRKILTLQALVHFLGDQRKFRGTQSTSKQDVERLNDKIESLLHAELEEVQVILKELEKGPQVTQLVDEPVKKISSQEKVLETQETLKTDKSFQGLEGSNSGNTQGGRPYVQDDTSLSLGDRRNGYSQVMSRQQGDSMLNKESYASERIDGPSSPLFVRETQEDATCSNMLDWNLPAFVIHLGVDGIRSLGPSKLVELAWNYYHRPVPHPCVLDKNEIPCNGQYLKDCMNYQSQRLKQLQDEKRQLENMHSWLAKTFRESSLRELKK